MKIQFVKYAKIIIPVLALLLILSTAQNVMYYIKYNDALELLTYSATTIYDEKPEYEHIKNELEGKLLSVEKGVETDGVVKDLLDRAEKHGFDREYVRAEIYNFAFLDNWEYYCEAHKDTRK